MPEPTDARVRDAIATAADSLGLSHRLIPCGAGHDAQSLAPLAPIGMIFVPSVGGISHSPRELTQPEDVVNGANVLLQTMLTLDTMDWLNPSTAGSSVLRPPHPGRRDPG